MGRTPITDKATNKIVFYLNDKDYSQAKEIARQNDSSVGVFAKKQLLNIINNESEETSMEFILKLNENVLTSDERKKGEIKQKKLYY